MPAAVRPFLTGAARALRRAAATLRPPTRTAPAPAGPAADDLLEGLDLDRWADVLTPAATDPDTIARTLDHLRLAWSSHPEQRLGQLLVNAASLSGLDLWEAGGDDWAAALDRLDDTAAG